MEFLLKAIEYATNNPIDVIYVIGCVISLCIHLHLHTFESLFYGYSYSIPEEDVAELTALIEKLSNEMDESPGC